MTPAETAAILRQLTEWRQGADVDPPAPLAVDKAIDAAIEMIDRLEAAEEDRSNFIVEMGRLCAQCDALRAKIEAMERQEPVGQFIQHPSNGLWEQDGYGDNPDARPLYALPGVKGE